MEVASLLEFHRADYLAVAYADEGVDLRRHGISLPIMVMNPAPDSFDTLRQYHLEPEIYSFELLHAYLAAARQQPLPPVHLKLDTGMRRLGFGEEDLPELRRAAARQRRPAARSQRPHPPGQRRRARPRCLLAGAAGRFSPHGAPPGIRAGLLHYAPRAQLGRHPALPRGPARHGAPGHRPLRRGCQRPGARRAAARQHPAHHHLAGENPARRPHRGLRPPWRGYRSGPPHCHAGHWLRRWLRPALRQRGRRGAHSGAARPIGGQSCAWICAWWT